MGKLIQKVNMLSEIEELIKLRKKNNITQRELAEQLEIPVTTVNRWENKKTNPSNLVLAKIRYFLKHFNRDGV